MQPVTIDYTNYKGDRALRLVTPQSIFFGVTQFHPEEQWFLRANDVMRGVSREFAMRDIHAWGQAKVVGVIPTNLTDAERQRVKEKYGASLVDYCQVRALEFDREADKTQPIIGQIDKAARASVWKEVAELLRQRGIE